MVIITAIAFVSDCDKGNAIACLITTIMSLFLYALFTLIQDKPSLYNQPYKIPEHNQPQANKLIYDFIVRIKGLSLLLLTLLVFGVCFSYDAILYCSIALYSAICIVLTSNCLSKLKSLR